MTPTSCQLKNPIREIKIVASSDNAQKITVTIFLTEHVAACCVQADLSFVEFQGHGHFLRELFEFKEGRPGHYLQATLSLPVAGAYTYRIVTRIMGHSMSQEGTYAASH